MPDQPPQFDIDIVDFPAKHLVGLKVRSNISRSTIDCPPLWNEFIPQLKKFPGRTRNKTYGLFCMVDEWITFDFRVAVETPPDFKLPRGMEAYQLEAARYARCLVPNSAELLMAYSAIYGTWVQDQDEYDIVKPGFCFELYPPHWNPSVPFELYARVTAKKSP